MRYDSLVMRNSPFSRRGISLDRFQALSSVATAGSIVAAGKGSPIKQSLISRQIKELETAMGVPLLDRSRMPHSLSPEGIRLDLAFREFKGNLESIIQESSSESPLISIGAGESLIQWILLPALGKSVINGSLRISFRNLTSREIVESLRSRRIDLGLLSGFEFEKDLETRQIASFGVCLVFNPSLGISSKRVDWTDLAAHQLAVLEGGGRLRDRINQVCREADTGPKIGMECTSYPQLLETCRQFDFCAIVPKIATPTAKGLGLKVATCRQFDDFTIDLKLAWNPARSAIFPPILDVVKILTN